jgi:uncharacterized repeat protein (TIGR01451 family)
MAIGNIAPFASTPARAENAAAPRPALSNYTLHLSLFDATDTNVPPTSLHIPFKYIINVDNTGTTDQRSPADDNYACSPTLGDGSVNPNYPDSCKWVSIAGRANHSPIYTQGDQNDFPNGVFTVDGQVVNLPEGRYLISVLADNYKIDGAHFSIPSDGSNVEVTMQPYDLPTATVQAAVFEDMAPTNSAPDLPAERGLAGFRAHIKDYIDEVTTDIFGNPLGAEYDTNGNYIAGTGGVVLSKCYVVDGGVDVGWVNPANSKGECPLALPANNPKMFNIHYPHTLVAAPTTGAIEGKVIIPNVGPNRYALSVTPPDNSGWIQTTTLEGNHDWDAWVMEGATGLDTEFVVAGEPFPATFFGFVPPSLNTMSGGHAITGTGMAVSAYIPPVGGLVAAEGVSGAKPRTVNPIHRLFVSLSDLNAGDQTVYIHEFGCEINPVINCDVVPVNFTIPNVPDGDYVLGVWDEPQDYIFGVQNVSVHGGDVNIGDMSLVGWWAPIYGYVFNDLNGDGKRCDNDDGKTNCEPGIPNFPIVVRTRENTIMDRGTVAVTTDANGYYWMESTYPMTQWLVEEAYADGFQTTGITYQADNQPNSTTVLGAGVDVNIHPVIGLTARFDWGVKAYDKGTNGGIVGTVSYDTTRNELNPAYAAIEDWQPSISDLTVNLYAPVACGTHPNTPCDADGQYELAQDGSFALGQLLNQYITENWEQPSGCVARDLNGVPLKFGTMDQQVLPYDPADSNNGFQDQTKPCIEAPMQGLQFGPMAEDQGTANAAFGATVDGNYGFGDGCYLADGVTPGLFDPDTGDCVTGSLRSLPSNKDYLVKVEIPDDALGRPMYKVTREEDINIANGDSFVPQVPPSACAGALHTVDVKGIAPDGPNATINPTFLEIGGSVYEGQQKPLCDMKLVHLSERKSIAPGFNLFTDVPLPGRFWGLIVDDLNYSSNPKQTGYGEKMGIPFAPVGIYDYTNRLITTVESDYNGLFDVLLPSTNRISCPTPSGVCANLYRFVGNDPGVPGRLNLNFNPQYRTIAAEFEAFAGLTVPADLAPTQVAISVQIPGTQTLTPIACTPDAAQPQLYRVDKPYANITSSNQTVTITGQGFGANPGQVLLGNTPLATTTWTPTQIVATLPTSLPGGPQQLKVTSAVGLSTVNGLTFHVIKTSGPLSGQYNPPILEVGPGKTYQPAETLPAVANHAIQNALDAAPNGALVVVYPNNPSADPRQNPRGAYYENLIISKRVKLQGVGPGSPDGSVRGTILDASAFGGDGPVADDWYTKINSLTWSGNQTVYDGAGISIYVPNTGNGAFPNSYNAITAPSIDGFDIRGGDQQGFPNNIDPVTGQNGQPAGVVTQGGAIFANAYAFNLQITNNVIQNNGGAYGTVRIGTPNLPGGETDNQNDGIRIANNRILANGGTNLAGAVGLFNGSDGYEVDHNDLCGNFSAEYGGAISHFGLSNSTGSGSNVKVSSIHDNRIYFNRSYDEGAGVMIAGELPVDPNANYNTANGAKGSGSVNIFNNLIQANLADDDGGGIRFLMAGNFPMNVYNNMIVNNVSTHEGGGVALDDASNVRFYNNTVMNNVTTATAITSDGNPAPAGLSTAYNSTQLQNYLNSLGGAPSTFSNPLLFNNIFWDNRAGKKDGVLGSVGIGLAGDNTAINPWDMGSVDAGILLSPTNSILQTSTGINSSPTNSFSDPLVVDGGYHIPLTFDFWRANTTNTIMMTAELPPTLMGNYHLKLGSPAISLGATSKASATAPSFDYDRDTRSAPIDSGADEIMLPLADLSITKTDNVTSVNQGATVNYTIVVTNSGPNAVSGATVTDTMPTALTGMTWTCTATAGSSCGAASGSGNINTTVSLLVNGSATFTANTTLSATATGNLVNTATVDVPADRSDPNAANNTAMDTDTIIVPLPTLNVLDNFNRANATTLGANWSQTSGTGTVIRLNGNQANCSLANNCLLGAAIWNGATNIFGTKQGVAFTFTSTPVGTTSLYLKASGGTASAPASFIRVRYTGTQIIVETTTNSGSAFTTQGTFAVTFANGDRLTAVANADGSVDVWKTTGAVTTYVGHSSAVAAFNGTGRIGIRLPATASVDDFRGGNP